MLFLYLRILSRLYFIYQFDLHSSYKLMILHFLLRDCAWNQIVWDVRGRDVKEKNSFYFCLRLAMQASISLERGEIRLIGRYFLLNCGSPDLNIGITQVFLVYPEMILLLKETQTQSNDSPMLLLCGTHSDLLLEADPFTCLERPHPCQRH